MYLSMLLNPLGTPSHSFCQLKNLMILRIIALSGCHAIILYLFGLYILITNPFNGVRELTVYQEINHAVDYFRDVAPVFFKAVLLR